MPGRAGRRAPWIAAGLGAFVALVAGSLYQEELPAELRLPLLLPLSALVSGLACAGWRTPERLPATRRRAWWMVSLAVLLAGLGGVLLLDLRFVMRTSTSGGDIATILVGERSPECPCEPSLDDTTCLAGVLYFESAELDRCWPRRWRVRLALSGSFLLALVGLGGVVGLVGSAPREEPPAHPQTRFDFHLRLDRSEGGLYRAVARVSQGREISESVSLAEVLRLADHFPLRFAGRLRGGGAEEGDGEATVPSPKRFGSALFEAVFTDDLRGVLRAVLEEAEAAEMPLRVWLNLQEVPELADLPWEYLFDRHGEGFLALSHDTPLLRCLESYEALEPLGVRPPLRLLVMISTPTDYGTLDAEAEWERIRQAAAPLVAAGRLELERLPDGTYATLRRRLRRPANPHPSEERPVHVFHFIGHGGFSEQDQEGVLVFEDAEGRGSPAGVEALAQALGAHHTLRLAILNSCNGARASHQDAFAGAAQTLLRGVPAVVAMQSEVTDETARRFAEVLYQALADGSPIDEAVSEVRNLLSGENNPEWGTPVLYLRATDGRLFKVDDGQDQAV